ncbi:MAG: protein phosphatase 2C domain-containing protein [Anaerolineae bacterium]|nr:protein phosphatase 2C domain-containing protein [Anaerolineae bacterium]
MNVRFDYESNIGQKRQINEDSFWPQTHSHEHSPNDPYGMLFVVADGMGGHGAGDIASALAVAEISRLYYSLGEEYADIGQRLQLAFQEAHQKICQVAAQSPATENMGATAVAAVVKYDEFKHQGEAWLAWAGDSRIYLLRRGQLRQLSRDHSRVWPLIEAGQISWDELRFHPDRSRVTNALTARRADVYPEIEWTSLKPGDQLLLCSDGLSGEVRPEEIAQILKTYPPEQAVQRLIERANAPKQFNRNGQIVTLEGGNDNITSIVITIPSRTDQTAVMSSPPTLVQQPAVSPPSRRLGLVVGVILVLLLVLGGGGLYFVFSNEGTGKVAVRATPTPLPFTATSSPEQNSIIIAVEAEGEQVIFTPTLEPASTSPKLPSEALETRLPTVTRGPLASPTAPPTTTPFPLPTATATPIVTPTLEPTPILLEPEPDEAGLIQYDASREIKFVWQWPGELSDDLSFEIRVGLAGKARVGAHDARLLRQEPTFQRLDDHKYTVTLVLSRATGVTRTASDYFWSVGVVQIEPEYELKIESAARQISLVVP